MEDVELRLVCVEIFFVGDDTCHRNQRFGAKRLPPCFYQIKTVHDVIPMVLPFSRLAVAIGSGRMTAW
ncbi:Uncharacterised protein [Neisseria gonorrhoeae]|uniref:Uncharacterized protein n=1 Tax=Neisseria gonorrhoeae TaxID=485 RepID=A0A378VTJ9_NEIGO|nr:Uncharacterised protein [Neisseria gonorrhoeae]